jgi:hypothetical protein
VAEIEADDNLNRCDAHAIDKEHATCQTRSTRRRCNSHVPDEHWASGEVADAARRSHLGVVGMFVHALRAS